MASFIFDRYVQAIGGVDPVSGVTVPILPTSAVGICLVEEAPEGENPIQQNDIFGDSSKNVNISTRIAEDTQSGTGVPAVAKLNTNDLTIKVVPVPTDYTQEPPVDGYTMIKSHSIKFGENPSVTTIQNVVGAVVFAYTGSANAEIPATLNESNAIPICYLDFGGTVDSSSGPFKVVFKGGIPDQEDDPTTTIDPDNPVYTDLYKEYGLVFQMK